MKGVEGARIQGRHVSAAAYASYTPPTTRPPRPVPLIAAIYEAWTAEVKRARDAYDRDPQSTHRQVTK